VSFPLYSPPFQEFLTRDAPLSGGNLRGRCDSPSGRGAYQIQAYYDRTSRDERPVAETRNSFDIDFQHQQPAGWRHQIVWGAGYRASSGRIDAVAPTAFSPPARRDHLYTAFVQDDVAVVAERLRLVLGTRLEHNPYSGVEFQPGARVLWTIDPTDTLFAAVTRAVRYGRCQGDAMVALDGQLLASPGADDEGSRERGRVAGTPVRRAQPAAPGPCAVLGGSRALAAVRLDPPIRIGVASRTGSRVRNLDVAAVSWRPVPRLEVAVVGRDLHAARHSSGRTPRSSSGEAHT